MVDSIDAILMGSGYSMRFGESDKLLHPFRGRALASHILDTVLATGCFTRVIFVAANPLVADLADGLDVAVIRNDAPWRGQCESIRLGVEASSSDHYFFFPCDQPLISAEMIRDLADHAAYGLIVEPVVRDIPSSPVIFSSAFRDELLSIPDGESGRWVKSRHLDKVMQVEIKDWSAMFDIDTPCDLDQAYKWALNH
jgi:molybdenum cofactor cytidylyltransferase